jgi:hypothetical protein
MAAYGAKESHQIAIRSTETHLVAPAVIELRRASDGWFAIASPRRAR